MTSLHVCFSKYPVKSQPEVGLSQDFLDFGQIGHDLTDASQSIPIPPNAIPFHATDYRPDLETFDLTSFGSFSSAAESLAHDHDAIVIPAYSPPSTPANATTPDFCLLDEHQDSVSTVAAPSPQFYSELQPPDTPSALFSSASSASSTCDQDISTSMLSPYGFYMEDINMIMPSPSSPSTWLANSMQTGLSIQSPSSSSLLFGIGSSSATTATTLTDQQQQRQQQQQTCYGSSYSSSSTISQVSAMTPSPVFQHYDSHNSNCTMDWTLQQNVTSHPQTLMTTTTMMAMNTMTPAQDNDNGDEEDVWLQSGRVMTDHADIYTSLPKPLFFSFQHENKTLSSPTPSSGKKQPGRRREYQCPHCQRTSNRSNNMKEHILTHDPKRPKNFPCVLCPKRFARKHDLKRHHQSHERNIEKMMVACGLVPGTSSSP